jgi:hypothetical protein
LRPSVSAAFAAAAGGEADLEEFNCFDAASCDAAFAMVLVDLLAGVRCVFAGFV